MRSLYKLSHAYCKALFMLAKSYLKAKGATILTPYLNQVFNADALEFMAKLPENCLDCVLIDPPYCSGGVKSLAERAKNTNDKYLLVRKDGKTYPEFIGDNKDQRVFTMWIGFIFAQIERILKPSSYFFSFIDWRMLPALSDAVQLADLAWRGVIVWDKGKGARPFANGFKQQCEFIVWGTKGALPNSETTFHYGYIQAFLHSNKKQHATQKPLEVLKHCLAIVPKGGIVLDCFAGSGSTGVACAHLGLNFIGVEKSKQYAQIAQENLRRALGDEGLFA
ncbi:DNA-methyltransferase [Helicobacter bizzozeronii]|uniref:DNA-methyltransferase n=1 Tax=Helicobacter bizzozeronii TaxID=56877 RepID=UPI001F248D1E|nr:site-specific DNA-methyltransferase [Helicobacter bizzozeronii]